MIYQKTGEHILTGLAMSTYYLEDIQQKKVNVFVIKEKICYTMKNLIEML